MGHVAIRGFSLSLRELTLESAIGAGPHGDLSLRELALFRTTRRIGRYAHNPFPEHK